MLRTVSWLTTPSDNFVFCSAERANLPSWFIKSLILCLWQIRLLALDTQLTKQTMSGSKNSRKGVKKGVKTSVAKYGYDPFYNFEKKRRTRAKNDLQVEVKTGAVLAFNPRK